MPINEINEKYETYGQLILPYKHENWSRFDLFGAVEQAKSFNRDAAQPAAEARVIPNPHDSMGRHCATATKLRLRQGSCRR